MFEQIFIGNTKPAHRIPKTQTGKPRVANTSPAAADTGRFLYPNLFCPENLDTIHGPALA